MKTTISDKINEISMASKKKKTARKDDVDPKILRKIKEPKIDLIDDIEETVQDDDLLDDEKTEEVGEESV